ncbi:PQQ-binding-like beta-propeller repeat protein [Rhodococcus sp. NPDC019647]|uniref:outer membrane protein assembly factor BamB family protein n=2 Tax=unclassified Rhodococcus (in: high G+C Gram-positive bacteria) TaxID=192944 RepID=UPI0033EBDF95
MNDARVLAHRYRLDAVLGIGGMGRVYRAWDSVLDRPVAVKVLRTELLEEDPTGNCLERFRREARIVASFDHPAIVHVYDLGEDMLGGERAHFLVMQLVSGTTLQQRHRTDGPLALPLLVHVMGDVLSALQHAHERGVVHRDVKPANVMLTDSGAVKVMDFGIAHLRGCSNLLTGTGNIIGTVAYLAPEQARDSRLVDARSDVYSVGCMLYHLLTDRLPFPGDNPWQILASQLERRYVPASEVRPMLGTVFDDVLKRALALEPDHRYSSAAEMCVELLALKPSLSTEPGQFASDRTSATASASVTMLSGPDDTETQVANLPSEFHSKAPASGPLGLQTGSSPEVRHPSFDSLGPPPLTPASPPTDQPLVGRTGPSRREVLAGLGAGAVLVAGGAAIWLFTSSSDGKSSSPTLSGRPGAVLWTASAGTVIIFSAPTLGAGLVYIGGYDNNVYALDAATGVERWTAATGDRVRPSPAFADGLVYVASWDGNVYAFEAKTGEERWKTAPGNPGDTFPVSPVVSDGTVYFGATDWYVYGLDSATGAMRWKTRTNGAAAAAPAVADNVVYLGTEGYVYALDAHTGTAHWASQVGGQVWSSPAVGDGRVYLGNEDFAVYALDAGSGEVRWRTLTGGEVYSSPAAAGGLVYVGSYDKNVYALDAGSGEVRWKTLTGGQVHSSPAVADGVVYVASWDGYLYALGAQDGAVRWKTPMGGQVWSSPTVSDKLVYLGNDNGKVYAVER